MSQKKVTLKLLADRVLVKVDSAETKTKSGLYIPNSAVVKPLFGTVISAGPGHPNNLMTVKEGDRVLYRQGAGMDITLNEEPVLIMLESDVYAIM